MNNLNLIIGIELNPFKWDLKHESFSGEGWSKIIQSQFIFILFNLTYLPPTKDAGAE